VKFSTEVLYRKLPSKCEFRENRYSERHNLLKGVNEFTSVFPHLSPNLGEIWYRGSEHKALKHLLVS
jgi:hypothetical protein